MTNINDIKYRATTKGISPVMKMVADMLIEFGAIEEDERICIYDSNEKGYRNYDAVARLLISCYKNGKRNPYKKVAAELNISRNYVEYLGEY